jgi:uroporphyrinogen decarboxylase
VEATLLAKPVKTDGEGFLKCIRREGMPNRVHFVELFLDAEMEDCIDQRFGISKGLDPADPFFAFRRKITLQRFLGYDYVVAGVDNIDLTFVWHATKDCAGLAKPGGRNFVESTRGPITNWDEFEKYPWPDLSQASTTGLEWFNKNLPDDMIIIGGLTVHALEWITWLMGYETLCTSLCEQPELVQAVCDKVLEINECAVKTMLQFDRVRVIWGSDDMGFRTGPLVDPQSMRTYVLPIHKRCAQLCHDAGRLYILHSCGKLELIMDDLIDDVRIDAKHSYEDTIEDVRQVKDSYGARIAMLGGIDVDFLCRSSEKDVRSRVRATLEKCMPGGGYCLGTGNSVANYIPVDNYLAMLDEGRRFELRN